MAAIVEWIMTAVVALAGGTVGGVILAPKISWRSEQGRRRYEAETTIRKALETYRSTMAYRHREITIKQSYPAEYASTASQEQLARPSLVSCHTFLDASENSSGGIWLSSSASGASAMRRNESTSLRVSVVREARMHGTFNA